MMNRRILCFPIREEIKKPPNRTSTPFKYLVPSLEQMANVKLVLSLFYQTASESFPAFGNLPDLEPISNEVCEIVSQLSVPNCLKEKLYFWIFQIEEEMIRSCRHFNTIKGEMQKDNWRDLEYMIWTSRGAVDYFKTAELMMDGSEYAYTTRAMKQSLARYYSMEARNSLFDGWFFINERPARAGDAFDTPDEQRIQMLGMWFHTARSRYVIEFHFVKQHYCFVLAKLGKNALKTVLREMGWDVLMIFMQDLLHKDYFLQIISLMKKYNIHLNFFQDAWFELCNSKIKSINSPYSPLCGELYSLFPDSISRSLQMASLHLETLDWMVKFDLLKYIISRLTLDDRKKLLDSFESAVLGLLKKSQFQLFKTFVELCLPMDEDIVGYREKLMREQRVNIVTDCCSSANLTQLEEFLKWLLGNDVQKMKQFKQDVILDSFSSTLNYIRLPYVEDFRESEEGEIPKPNFKAMDVLLEWCFSDTKEIINFKAILVRNMVFTCGSGRVLRPSVDIFETEFKLWLFENDTEKINHFNFKSNFSCISKMFISDIHTIISKDMMENFHFTRIN